MLLWLSGVTPILDSELGFVYKQPAWWNPTANLCGLGNIRDHFSGMRGTLNKKKEALPTDIISASKMMLS